jgi:hypothetical protein
MDPRQQRAFNQTRNSFLGLNVVAGDFPSSSLANWLLKLTPDSGAGLWIAPFRGLPAASGGMQFDLVYLDANCRVIDLVESFPLFQLSASTQPAASVLVLPSKAIFSSDTRHGDNLVICNPDDLRKLLGLAGGGGSRIHAVANPVQNSDRPGGRTLLFPVGEPSRRDNLPQDAAPSIAPEPTENIPVKERAEPTPPRQGLLARWLFPSPTDRRAAPRKSVDNLTASFWTGENPMASAVRHISSSGLYVVTTERWYPGTLVRMTLTITNAVEEALEAWICVYAEAIRWGNDGVELRFALANHRKKDRRQYQPVEGADRKQLDQFLKRLPDEGQQTRNSVSNELSKPLDYRVN